MVKILTKKREALKNNLIMRLETHNEDLMSCQRFFLRRICEIYSEKGHIPYYFQISIDYPGNEGFIDKAIEIIESQFVSDSEKNKKIESLKKIKIWLRQKENFTSNQQITNSITFALNNMLSVFSDQETTLFKPYTKTSVSEGEDINNMVYVKIRVLQGLDISICIGYFNETVPLFFRRKRIGTFIGSRGLPQQRIEKYCNEMLTEAIRRAAF